MQINVQAFVDNLYYLGKGMLGIFVSLAVIILVTILLNKLSGGKNEEK